MCEDDMNPEPYIHHASDRRCYYGAPCSDLKREWDSLANLQARLEALAPGFRCTYFPAEGKYFAVISRDTTTGWHYEEFTQTMYADKGQCLLEAWHILTKRVESA